MKMYRYISSLSNKNRLSQCGGKAFNLSLLKRLGYPVPDGFCIKVGAYKKFLKKNDIYPLVIELQRQITFKKYSKLLVKKIQDAIVESDMLPEIQSEIVSIINHHQQQKLAVRSSAINEDSLNESYAGILETILDVPIDPSSIVHAVKMVWKSLFSERLIEYVLERKIKNFQFLTAVLVQEMLESKQAGVAFSVHPVTMDPEVIYIEDTYLAGEKLASGEVVPKIYQFYKNQIYFETHDVWLTTLLQYILKLEAYFNQPIDVEWARVNKKVFLLQVRPITTITNKKIRVWTDENVGEVLPEVVTPLTWSIMVDSVNKGFLWTVKMIGIQVTVDMKLFRLLQGKAYFNRSLFQNLTKKISLSKFHKNIHTNIFILKLFPLVMNQLYILIRFLFLLWWLPLKSRQLEKKHLPLTPGKINSKKEWLPIINILHTLEKTYMRYHVANTLVGEILYQFLMVLVRKKDSNQSVPLLMKNFSRIGNARSVASGEALQKLLKVIKYQMQQERVKNKDFETFENFIMTNDVLKIEFEQFLKNYGHMSDQEFELAYPRWVEEPSRILRILYNLSYGLHSRTDTLTPFTFPSEVETNRSVLQFIKEKIIDRLIKLTKIFYRNRENLKQRFLEIHYELKKVILNAGQSLQKRGILNDLTDIYFVQLPELLKLGTNYRYALVNNLKSNIGLRRAEFEKNQKLFHPGRILEIDGTFDSHSLPVEGEDGILRGIACSTGSIKGSARVLLDYADSSQLKKGEILVTHSANPGWVPLFLLTSGVVTEIGGALSHSAIIAREFGLPMVAAVNNACRVIHTGDYLLLDGSNGVVQILQKS